MQAISAACITLLCKVSLQLAWCKLMPALVIVPTQPLLISGAGLNTCNS